jgi:hypothetical protein
MWVHPEDAAENAVVLFVYCAGARLDDGGIHGGALRFGKRIEIRPIKPLQQQAGYTAPDQGYIHPKSTRIFTLPLPFKVKLRPPVCVQHTGKFGSAKTWYGELAPCQLRAMPGMAHTPRVCAGMSLAFSSIRMLGLFKVI